MALQKTRPSKSEDAFRTIGEVSREIGTPQHVLRFWETKFPQIQPVKGPGGRRYYRAEDVALIKKIQNFLYNDGFTIKGVQKILSGKEYSISDLTSSAKESLDGQQPNIDDALEMLKEIQSKLEKLSNDNV